MSTDKASAASGPLGLLGAVTLAGDRLNTEGSDRLRCLNVSEMVYQEVKQTKTGCRQGLQPTPQPTDLCVFR